MRKLPLLLALSMLLAALVFAGALLLRYEEQPAEKILHSGTIRIGYAWEPPYAYRDEHGQVTGEGPEVARAILARMGIDRHIWIQGDFANLIPELRAGRFDMIAAGMFITPERARLVAFSSPSACIESALAVLRGNPRKIHTLSDLATRRELHLGVLTGAVEAEAAHRAGIPPERITAFATLELAVEGLLQGVTDAMALSGPSVNYLAQQHAQLQRAVPHDGKQPYSGCSAFVFRKEDEALRQAFEHHLQTYVGSPEHLARVAPFGFARANLPAVALGKEKP